MKRSIFLKLALILMAILLLIEGAMLAGMYLLLSGNILDSCRDTIRRTATMAVHWFEMYDPNDLEDCKLASQAFTELCDDLEVTYIYAIMPDVEKKDEKYLAIGTQKDDDSLFRKTRYPGYVAKGTLTDEELQAFIGDSSGVFVRESNQFGDMLIVYMPVKRYLDIHTNKMVNQTVSFIGAEISMDEVMGRLHNNFLAIVPITMLPSIAITIAVALVLYFKISRPLQTISGRMKHFIDDRSKGFERLPVKGKDELADMSASFNLMAEELDRYLEQVSEMNRQTAALQIACSIQMGLLEPPAFSNSAVALRAYICPALDVGGDLYDYQELPDGKICVIIGDVSDKGVSAALLMSRAVTLLHQYAATGMSPSQIMFEYNNLLAAHNPNIMFITTFIGIYDPSAHRLTYSNAGHNTPYLLADTPVPLDGAHGVAAGIFKDAAYTDATVDFCLGDTLFLYTDGVTEAKNADDEMFEEAALEEALNEALRTGDDVIDTVLRRLNAFTGDAAQSDDVTMLTLRAVGGTRRSLRLEARRENVEAINSALDEMQLPKDTLFTLRLMAEEIFVNICNYAYPDGGGEAEIILERMPDKVKMTFIDSGTPFNPTRDLLKIEEYDAAHAVGGLGRYLTFTLADAYSYTNSHGYNRLTVEKRLPS